MSSEPVKEEDDGMPAVQGKTPRWASAVCAVCAAAGIYMLDALSVFVVSAACFGILRIIQAAARMPHPLAWKEYLEFAVPLSLCAALVLSAKGWSERREK